MQATLRGVRSGETLGVAVVAPLQTAAEQPVGRGDEDEDEGHHNGSYHHPLIPSLRAFRCANRNVIDIFSFSWDPSETFIGNCSLILFNSHLPA